MTTTPLPVSFPAATERTGPGTCAPFAALPHALRKDPRLSDKAVLLAAALLEYARNKTFCWPSNQRLAQDLRCSPRTVQLALAQLKVAGWVRIELGAENPTGRLIRLAWREGPCASPPLPVAPPPVPRVAPEEDRERERNPAKEIRARISRRPRPETTTTPPVVPRSSTNDEVCVLGATQSGSAPAEPDFRVSSTALSLGKPPITDEPPPPPTATVMPPDPRQACGSVFSAVDLPVVLSAAESGCLASLCPATKDRVMTWLMTGDSILIAEARRLLVPPREKIPAPATLPDLLARIQEDPAFVPLAAQALSLEFRDAKSFSGFKVRLEEAWRGEISVEALTSAYRQAASGKARNPGAVFMHALKHPGLT